MLYYFQWRSAVYVVLLKLNDNMDRLVHLDFKGAPLKCDYLEKVLVSIKSWGATGVLIEWEDTFPFSGDLVDIGSQGQGSGDNMYTPEEVRHIIEFAKANGLLVIQLVQSIGHMEYVLKHPAFRHLREEPKSPAVLCPSSVQSRPLVKEMLSQVLEAQPDAEYLHIGADEIWHAGICEACKEKSIASPYKVASLYLEHIRDLTLFIKQKRPNLNVLIWDDMLRNLDRECLKAYNMGELVQPVVWNYNTAENFSISPELWQMYRDEFGQCWGGSAFKGANGSCQIVSPVQRYVSNHIAWVKEINKVKEQGVQFGGVILTGWSRYDHYATLCELMPVSIPSLAFCLKILGNMNTEATSTEYWPTNDWPGVELAMAIHKFVNLRDQCLAYLRDDSVMTWLNPWQITSEYTNPLHVDAIARNADRLKTQLLAMQPELTLYLHALTGPRSVAEWLGTWFRPILSQITHLQQVADDRRNCDASPMPKIVEIN